MYARRWTGPEAKMGHLTAISMVIPVREKTRTISSGDASLPFSSSLRQEANYLQSWTDYYFGLNHAVSFGDRLRLGVGIDLLHSRRELRTLSTTTGRVTVSDVVLSSSSHATVRTLALVPILGIQGRIVEQMWAGVGVALPSMHLSGRVDGGSNNSSRLPNFERGLVTRESETTEVGRRTSDRPWRSASFCSSGWSR